MNSFKRVLTGCVLFVLVFIISGCQESDKSKYEKAQALMSKGEYIEAAEKFAELVDYEDSAKLVLYCKAISAEEKDDYDTAISTYKSLGDFKDCQSRIDSLTSKIQKEKYDQAQGLIAKGEYAKAAEKFEELDDYENSTNMVLYCKALVAEEKGDYDTAISLYRSLGDFRDCKSRIEDIAPKAIKAKYEKAQSLMAQSNYAEAGTLFDELGSYEESSKLSMYCKAVDAGENGRYDEAFSTLNILGDYRDCKLLFSYYKARQLESLDSALSWVEASSMYESINPFKDSQIRKESCREKAYAKVSELIDSSDFSSAKEILNALSGIHYMDSDNYYKYIEAMEYEYNGDFLKAVDVYSALGDYRDSKEQVSLVYERTYKKAADLYDSGLYMDAYDIYKQIPDYKDIPELLSKDENIKAAIAEYQRILDNYAVGKKVVFGEYKNSPLSWLIIDSQDEKRLLLCMKSIGRKPFDSNEITTWGTSAMRSWLNSDFLKSAFTDKQQEIILLSHLDNSQTKTDMKGIYSLVEPDTDDKVFLLSYQEALNYQDVFALVIEEDGFTRSIRDDNCVIHFSRDPKYNGPVGNPPSWDARIVPAIWVNVNGIIER